MKLLRHLALAAIGAFALGPASGHAAAACPEGALGTARVLVVDTGTTARVGRKHFAATLPLSPKEVVLTFDDGPWPGTTDRVLDALKRECVRATFFMLGRNAVAHPALARRALAEGHSIGNHTYSHPLLGRMAVDRAEAEIDRGFAALETVLHGGPRPTPSTPFFRFPGFSSGTAILERLERRRIVVFGADFWVSDWNPMTSAQTLAQVLARLEKARGGIIVLHDTRTHTADMIPAFLRELKRRDYRVVHVVPAPVGTAALAPQP